MDVEALNKLSPGQKSELINTVKTQTALANMQVLLEHISEKCFTKCITSPGSSFSGSEQKCVSSCMDRYIDSFNTVSKSYLEKLRNETNKM